MRTYWIVSSGFISYVIGVATSRKYGKRYRAKGYQRMSRKNALHDLSYKVHKPLYISVTIDGQKGYDRFEVARALRTSGEP